MCFIAHALHGLEDYLGRDDSWAGHLGRTRNTRAGSGARCSLKRHDRDATRGVPSFSTNTITRFGTDGSPTSQERQPYSSDWFT